ADSRRPIRERIHRFAHDAAEFHDREVAGTQALLAPVRNGSHRLPHRHVLHGDAADAGEVAELHRLAVLEIVVVTRALLAVFPVEVDAELRAAELAPRFL